jgi:hypothetical protein
MGCFNHLDVCNFGEFCVISEQEGVIHAEIPLASVPPPPGFFRALSQWAKTAVLVEEMSVSKFQVQITPYQWFDIILGLLSPHELGVFNVSDVLVISTQEGFDNPQLGQL